MVKKQRHMLTTNKVEATHLRTLRVLPKSKLHRSSFEPRCMGVVLHATLGLHQATTVTSETLGYSLGPKANAQLQQMTKKQAYHAQRHRLPATIRAKYSLRCAKLKLKDLDKLSTESVRGQNTDHDY